jgi:hypothetical protein
MTVFRHFSSGAISILLDRRFGNRRISAVFRECYPHPPLSGSARHLARVKWRAITAPLGFGSSHVVRQHPANTGYHWGYSGNPKWKYWRLSVLKGIFFDSRYPKSFVASKFFPIQRSRLSSGIHLWPGLYKSRLPSDPNWSIIQPIPDLSTREYP